MIDVDEDKGGDAGPLYLPPTCTVKTPHGRHYYFSISADLPCPTTVGELGPHIDTRGDNAYVIGPGSIVGDLPYDSQEVA